MGACFNYLTYDDQPQTEIRSQFKEAVEYSLHERGHSYSGEIGMLGGIAPNGFQDKNFKDENEAHEWLADNHHKWNQALAVSFVRDNKKKWMVGGWCSS